jgi:hypothetical protein
MTRQHDASRTSWFNVRVVVVVIFLLQRSRSTHSGSGSGSLASSRLLVDDLIDGDRNKKHFEMVVAADE